MVQAWFARQLDRVTDPAFAEFFAKRMALPGLAAAEFNHRIIERDGVRLLGGIRFYGGDPARSFIELIAWGTADGVPSADVDWQALRQVVAGEWRSFRPQSIRIFLPMGTQLPPDAELDMTVHVGSYASMARLPQDKARHVRLVPVADIGAALRLVRRRYRDMATTDPALARNIRPVSRKGLAASAAEGRAFSIVADPGVVGLLATEAEAIEWIEGDVVLEEVVASAHAGRGFAAAAQYLLAARMQTDAPDRLLIGTIDALNPASRITAERAGRPAILCYAFLPLPD
jgi:hypothetical protein